MVVTNDVFDVFLQSYMECALFASTDIDNDGVEFLDKNYGIEDFAEETVEKMSEDCRKFLEKNGELIEDFPRMAGMDFFLTRNSHGAGFWDGDWEEKGEVLTAACKEFAEQILYVGDDGKIYVF